MTRHPRLLGIAALTLAMAVAPATLDAQQTRTNIPATSKIILITGSTDGLGREVARRLADSGAHIIVHGRNRERGEALVSEITKGGRGSARFYAADFSSLQQVRDFASAILRDYNRLDVLVNNAGISLTGSERRVSADGHELTFAVNYLAGFTLVEALLPLLERSAPSRIVNVASRAQSPVNFDDVMMTAGYSGGRAYGQSKLAQIMHAGDLARSLASKRIVVVALHPATMMNTSMVAKMGATPRSTVDEGATALVRLIRAKDVTNGAYYNGLVEARAHAQAYDTAAVSRLRKLSIDLTRKR